MHVMRSRLHLQHAGPDGDMYQGIGSGGVFTAPSAAATDVSGAGRRLRCAAIDGTGADAVRHPRSLVEGETGENHTHAMMSGCSDAVLTITGGCGK